jgi:hypothetical protein
MSGLEHDSSIGTPYRRARYSGSARPAWRMNHIGGVPADSAGSTRREVTV